MVQHVLELVDWQGEMDGAQHPAFGMVKDVAVEDPCAGPLVEADEKAPGVFERDIDRVLPLERAWTHEHFRKLLDCWPIFVRRALEAAGFRISVVRIEQMWVPVEIVVGHAE